jgi:hypothetical protein
MRVGVVGNGVRNGMGAGTAWAVLFAAGVILCGITVTPRAALAQRNPIHYFHAADMPPGTIGRGQLLRGGPLPGYFQPVEIKAPAGAKISLAVNGDFEPPQANPVLVGLLIGGVYPLKVTGIPRNEGLEVFPTIEVINRLYPPRGLENHFPVPIEITHEELEMALAGRFVIRVIYLEDPRNAFPRADRPGDQRYQEVRSDEDPLRAADRLGRPMAILRMGSRTPDYDASSGRLAVAAPPFTKLTKPALPPPRKTGLEPSAPLPPGTSSRNIPRTLPTGEPVSGGYTVLPAGGTDRQR